MLAPWPSPCRVLEAEAESGTEKMQEMKEIASFRRAGGKGTVQTWNEPLHIPDEDAKKRLPEQDGRQKLDSIKDYHWV